MLLCVRYMWKTSVTIMYLCGLSIADLRDKRVPVWLLAMGGLWSLVVCVIEWQNGRNSILEWGMALLPGAVLISLALATGKVGLADGIVVAELGLLLGYRDTFFMLVISLFAMSVLSMVLLAARRVRKSTEMPYIPFLCVVYCAYQIWGGSEGM